MSKIDSIQFSLSGIETKQYATFFENFDSKKEAQIDIEVGFAAEINLNEIWVSTKLGFLQKRKHVAKIEVCCKFNIAPESWLACSNGNTLVFQKDFMAHLTAVSVGTVRGILHAKTTNTPFSNHFVPLLNIEEIVKEEVVFELD